SSPPATLTVGHAPSVTSQPTNAVAAVGDTVSLTVGASGTPTLTYAWKHNGAALVNDGSHIFGADTATLTIVGVQATDALCYTVVVSGPYSPAATSAAALLTVITAPCQPNSVPGQIIYD